MRLRSGLPVLAAVALLGACGGGGEQTYTVTAAAMEPTLRCAGSSGCSGETADVAVVEELGTNAELRRGDIVLFTAPAAAADVCGVAGEQLMRVIALPGETVETTATGVVVNGDPLEEPHLEHSHEGLATEPRTLADDELFVLGDYRFVSCDSRLWGPVPRDAVTGRVVAVERGGERIELS